jgi:hypothetical protein
MRIFAGDFTPGKIQGVQATQTMWMVAVLMMLIPIVMVVLTVTLKYPAIRWVSIVAAAVLFVFNLIGLPGYPGLYDRFLIIVGLVFNVLIVWQAWKWV